MLGNDTRILAYLQQLPQSKYVLHGSPHRLEVLEPRDPNYSGRPELGQTAVYASMSLEVALMHATIIPNRSIGYRLKRGGLIHVYAEGAVHYRPGFIYVLPQKEFEVIDFVGIYCFSKRPVRPVKIIPVSPHLLRARDNIEFGRGMPRL